MIDILAIQIEKHQFVIKRHQYPWSENDNDVNYTISRLLKSGTANRLYYFYEFDDNIVSDNEASNYKEYYLKAIKKFRNLKVLT